MRKTGLFKRILSGLSACVIAVSLALPFADVCAYAADPSNTDLSHQSFELYPDEDDSDKVITLDGLMPEGAEAEAGDEHDDGFSRYGCDKAGKQHDCQGGFCYCFHNV